jgi:hypothetical protein
MSKVNNTDPYEQLTNAIVLQAVRDYREVNKKLCRGRKNADAQAVKDECIRFFRSGWFQALTSVDAEYLIRKLNQEVEA